MNACSCHRLLSGLLLLAWLSSAAGCGGGDPLPAPDVARDPGAVGVTTVDGAAFDAGIWLTRQERVTVRGQAPAEAVGVEATREGEPGPTASAGVGGDGTYAVDLQLAAGEGMNVFSLRARAEDGSTGAATLLRIFRRTTPPTPFVVDPLPAVTGATSVTVQGSAEEGIVVIVRVVGGAAPAQARKPAGVARFQVAVPLARDQEQRLVVTGEDLAGNTTAQVVRTIVQDSTAPSPPEVAGPPGPVSAAEVTLQGRAPEAAQVEATAADGSSTTTPVGGDGGFALRVPLPAEGENRFAIVAVDAAGNRSAPVSVVVVRDTVAPPPPSDLTLSGRPVAPGEQVVITSPFVTIGGRAEPGATVTAQGDGLLSTGTAAPDGSFSLAGQVSRQDVAIRVAVEAIDAAGNRSGAVSFDLVWTSADTGGR